MEHIALLRYTIHRAPSQHFLPQGIPQDPIHGFSAQQALEVSHRQHSGEVGLENALAAKSGHAIDSV